MLRIHCTNFHVSDLKILHIYSKIVQNIFFSGNSTRADAGEICKRRRLNPDGFFIKNIWKYPCGIL